MRWTENVSVLENSSEHYVKYFTINVDNKLRLYFRYIKLKYIIKIILIKNETTDLF